MTGVNLASHLIRVGRLAHLMWFAAIHELHQRKVIGPAGSICDCDMRPSNYKNAHRKWLIVFARHRGNRKKCQALRGECPRNEAPRILQSSFLYC